jgi:hypothetical protein
MPVRLTLNSSKGISGLTREEYDNSIVFEVRVCIQIELIRVFALSGVSMSIMMYLVILGIFLTIILRLNEYQPKQLQL